MSQVAGVCNAACFLASREGRTDIAMTDLRKAVEQAKYGRATDLQRCAAGAAWRVVAPCSGVKPALYLWLAIVEGMGISSIW